MRLVEHDAELLLDLGGGAFEMRQEPRLDPLAQPEQPRAERRQMRAAALFFHHQGLADNPGTVWPRSIAQHDEPVGGAHAVAIVQHEKRIDLRLDEPVA